MCRRRIINTQSATTAASTDNGYAHGFADDDYCRSVQHNRVDHYECHVGHDQPGHTTGRCQQHAAQRPGICNTSADDDLYHHSDGTERHGHRNGYGDGEPDSADNYVFGFADRCFLWPEFHADLVNLECDFAHGRSWSRFSNARIRQCARHEYHGDNNFYSDGPGAGW